jgi:hypothetical protein
MEKSIGAVLRDLLFCKIFRHYGDTFTIIRANKEI